MYDTLNLHYDVNGTFLGSDKKTFISKKYGGNKNNNTLERLGNILASYNFTLPNNLKNFNGQYFSSITNYNNKYENINIFIRTYGVDLFDVYNYLNAHRGTFEIKGYGKILFRSGNNYIDPIPDTGEHWLKEPSNETTIEKMPYIEFFENNISNKIKNEDIKYNHKKHTWL